MAERNRFGLHMGNTTITLSTLKVHKLRFFSLLGKTLFYLCRFDKINLTSSFSVNNYRMVYLKLLLANLVIDHRTHALLLHKIKNFALVYQLNKASHAMAL